MVPPIERAPLTVTSPVTVTSSEKTAKPLTFKPEEKETSPLTFKPEEIITLVAIKGSKFKELI